MGSCEILNLRLPFFTSIFSWSVCLLINVAYLQPKSSGHASTSGTAPVVEESVPTVVDKLVDDVCNSPRATSMASTSGFYVLLSLLMLP